MSELGFTNLAVDSAHAFRTIMSAMSRPGRIHTLSTRLEVPPPLGHSAAAIALTLCDFETPIYLAPALRSPRLERYLRFHTGAPLMGRAKDAAFAFVRADELLPDAEELARGSHEYPDRSATLVVQTESISNAGPAELTGPGIKGTATLGVAGMSGRAWQFLADNHAGFPLGFDVIFTSPVAIAALPRSTAVRLMETV